MGTCAAPPSHAPAAAFTAADLAELPPEQRAKKEKALYFKEKALAPVITADELVTIALAKKMSSSWSTGPLSESLSMTPNGSTIPVPLLLLSSGGGARPVARPRSLGLNQVLRQEATG